MSDLFRDKEKVRDSKSLFPEAVQPFISFCIRNTFIVWPLLINNMKNVELAYIISLLTAYKHQTCWCDELVSQIGILAPNPRPETDPI